MLGRKIAEQNRLQIESQLPSDALISFDIQHLSSPPFNEYWSTVATDSYKSDHLKSSSQKSYIISRPSS